MFTFSKKVSTLEESEFGQYLELLTQLSIPVYSYYQALCLKYVLWHLILVFLEIIFQDVLYDWPMQL